VVSPVFISDHQLREDGVERHTESKVALFNWVGSSGAHRSPTHIPVSL